MSLFPQKSILDGWHTIHATLTDYDVSVEETWIISGALALPRVAAMEPWRDRFANDIIWCFQATPRSAGTGGTHTFMFDDMALCEIERVRFLNAAKAWKARRK